MCEGDLKFEESGTCVQELPLGGTNCLEPNFVCNEDNDCNDGTCVVNMVTLDVRRRKKREIQERQAER